MYDHKANAREAESSGINVCKRKGETLPTDATPSLTKGTVGTELAGGAEIATAAELGAYGETGEDRKHLYEARPDVQSRCPHERASERSMAWPED
jgi:hypothetical protein